jgi:hypothetical protein
MKLHHFVTQPEKTKKNLQELGKALRPALVEARPPVKVMKKAAHPPEHVEEGDDGMDDAIMTLASNSRLNMAKVKNYT